MEIYRCYSNNLKEFLMTGGLRYLLLAKDIKTDKTFWAFEKTEKFESLMKKWEENSPRK